MITPDITRRRKADLSSILASRRHVAIRHAMKPSKPSRRTLLPPRRIPVQSCFLIVQAISGIRAWDETCLRCLGSPASTVRDLGPEGSGSPANIVVATYINSRNLRAPRGLQMSKSSIVVNWETSLLSVMWHHRASKAKISCLGGTNSSCR